MPDTQFFVGQRLRTIGGIEVVVAGRHRSRGLRVVDDWPKTHYLTPRMIERCRLVPMTKADHLTPPFPPECRRITERVALLLKCTDRAVLKAVIKAHDFFQDRVVKAARQQLDTLPVQPKAETTPKPKTAKKRKAAA